MASSSKRDRADDADGPGHSKSKMVKGDGEVVDLQVVDDNDDEESTIDSNEPNPFYLNPVVKALMSQMTIEDLKRARHVCTLWDQYASLELKRLTCHLKSAQEQKLTQQCFWVDCSNGTYLPQNSVFAGLDHGGIKLYVARANHLGSMIPGKFQPVHKCAYIAYHGQEHTKTRYQILTAPEGSLSWVPATGSSIPQDSFKGGIDPVSREVLYIGRASLRGTLQVGKVYPSQGKCYIPYNGREYGYNNYEILKINALGKHMGVENF